MRFARISKTPMVGDKVVMLKPGFTMPGVVKHVYAAVCVLEFNRIALNGDVQTWTERVHMALLHVPLDSIGVIAKGY